MPMLSSEASLSEPAGSLVHSAASARMPIQPSGTERPPTPAMRMVLSLASQAPPSGSHSVTTSMFSLSVRKVRSSVMSAYFPTRWVR